MSVQYDPASAKLIAVSSTAAAAATRKFSVLCPRNAPIPEPQLADHVCSEQQHSQSANGSQELLKPQANGSAAVRRTTKFGVFEPQNSTAPSTAVSPEAPAPQKELKQHQESRSEAPVEAPAQAPATAAAIETNLVQQQQSSAKAAQTPSQLKRKTRKERKEKAQGRAQETSRQQLERALVARLQQWHTGAAEDASALTLPVALAGVTDAFFDRECKELAFSAELLPHDRQLVHAAALRR
jgi:hypothetical protein